MKRFLSPLLASLLLCTAAAREQTLVGVTPGEASYPKLDNKTCDSTCLFELLDSGQYLSFLSEFSRSGGDDFLGTVYAKLLNSITDFTPSLAKKSPVKLAILVPEKIIKNYANTIINSALAYLLAKRAQIKVKIFLTGSEDEAALKKALSDLNEGGYAYLIAGLTPKGAATVDNYLAAASYFSSARKLKIFIPTINKNSTSISNENIIFGGIDYDAQIAALLKRANARLLVLNDPSATALGLGDKIASAQAAREASGELNSSGAAKSAAAGSGAAGSAGGGGGEPSLSQLTVGEGRLDYEKLFKGAEDASIFFNTPLIKTALLSSQLRIYEAKPFVLLSTQLNFNPSFLSLTQPNDRKNFLIANSINNQNAEASYLNELFGQSIDYNWIAYATAVGLDYFYTEFMGGSGSLFDEKIRDGQVQYGVSLMRGLEANFIKD